MRYNKTQRRKRQRLKKDRRKTKQFMSIKRWFIKRWAGRSILCGPVVRSIAGTIVVT